MPPFEIRYSLFDILRFAFIVVSYKKIAINCIKKYFCMQVSWVKRYRFMTNGIVRKETCGCGNQARYLPDWQCCRSRPWSVGVVEYWIPGFDGLRSI